MIDLRGGLRRAGTKVRQLADPIVEGAAEITAHDVVVSRVAKPATR